MERTDAVRVCQVGYLPEETKFAMVTVSGPTVAEVRRANDGKTVLTVPVGPGKLDPDSGDELHPVDFSALKTAGTYYLNVPGAGSSYDFRIGKDAFAHSFRLAMRAFTGQRCGTAVSLAPDFPQYRYPACHTGDASFHVSSGKTGTKNVTGGWHDAGDFGRYIVNSGITTGTLLWAYELNPRKLRGLRLDLPESGNGTPDILNEIRWNLEWMLKMQDTDGGVWHKATTAQFPGFIMPQDDKAEMLIIGSGQAPYKTTGATADFAAVLAAAGRIYRPFDRAFANRCLRAAEGAWSWLQSTPDLTFRNPPGIGTGGYGDGNLKDERLWAAAELFRTTGRKEFNDYFLGHYGEWSPTLKGDSPQGWPAVQNMAMYAYALSGRKEADRSAVSRIKADAVKAADEIVARSRANGYRVPMLPRDYNWGSNSGVANYAMMVLLANRFTPKQEYRDCAQDSLHYLLGRNTFNTSFVTWLGTKWYMHPHHRPSGADKIEQPWPGMLAGGPNAEGKKPPARQWEDVEGNYRVNEMAINWNAPLVFVLVEALR
jgi:endoglucanase